MRMTIPFLTVLSLLVAPQAFAYVNLVAMPSSVSFSPTEVDGPLQSRTLQLVNYGNETAKNVQVFSACGNQFQVRDNCYFDLSPGSSCTIVTEFAPRQEGSFTCQINVYSFGGGSTQISLWATVSDRN